MEDNMIFRSKYFITVAHVFFLYFLLVIVDDGLDINLEVFLVGTIFVFILIYVAIRYYKIIITEENLVGYDFLGKRLSVKWNTIAEIKPIQFLLLKYIRVMSTESKRPLWIPLFLDDMRRFIEETSKNLELGNPLRVYFERHFSESNNDA